jgi:hypothetical protein
MRLISTFCLLLALRAGATTWFIDGSTGQKITNGFASVQNGDTVIFTNNLLGGLDSFTVPTNLTVTLNGNGLTNWGSWGLPCSPNNAWTLTNFVFSITNRYGLTIGSFSNEGYKPWRITHCTFTTPVSIANVGAYSAPGCMDHITATNMPPYIQWLEPIWNSQDAVGDDGWTGIDAVPGTNDQIVIEDSSFADVGTLGNNPNIYDGSCVFQAQYGARIMMRHCFLYYTMFEVHGSCTINGRLWELDSCILSNAQICIRGGSGVVCSNTGTAGFFVMGQECFTNYPATYQVGRGKSQVLFPAYVWANDVGVTNQFFLNAPGYCAVFVTNNMVALNRDVYMTAPGYTYAPYQYPYFQAGQPSPPLGLLVNWNK